MGLWRDRLGRKLRPPRRLTVTRSGRVYLAITIGVGLGALNTGNNLLYLVLGFLLALIVLSGVLSELTLRDLQVRRLLPDGVFATEPFALRYEVTRARGRGFALELREADGLTGDAAWVPWVMAGTPVVVRADASAPHRGPLRLTGVRASTRFPFGLFEKSRTLDLEHGLTVWPRRGFTCEPPGATEGRSVGEDARPRGRDGSGDLLDLRELGDGEDARHVHWKKSAAMGQLLRVERERDERPQYTLHVEATAPGEALERACEETAALTHRLLGEGAEVGLVAGGRKIRPGAGAGHERRLLTALAFVGFEPPEQR